MTAVVGDETLRQMHLGGIGGSAESMVLKAIGGKYVLYGSEADALEAVRKGRIEAFVMTLNYYKENDYRDKISVYPTRARKFAFRLRASQG